MIEAHRGRCFRTPCPNSRAEPFKVHICVSPFVYLSHSLSLTLDCDSAENCYGCFWCVTIDNDAIVSRKGIRYVCPPLCATLRVNHQKRKPWSSPWRALDSPWIVMNQLVKVMSIIRSSAKPTTTATIF